MLWDRLQSNISHPGPLVGGMCDEVEYEIILCPEGEAPGTCIETKRLTYGSVTEDEDELREEVTEFIVRNHIDRDIFYKYWDIWSIRETIDQL